LTLKNKIVTEASGNSTIIFYENINVEAIRFILSNDIMTENIRKLSKYE